MADSRTLALYQRLHGYQQGMPAGGGNSENGLAPALRRGEQVMRALLGTYHTLTADEVAARLGVTPAEVDRLHRERRLLGVVHEGRRLFPEFQFEGGRPLDGLAEALRSLRAIGDWTAFNFLVTGDARLGGRTPLDALREGDIAAVRHAAAAYGEHQPA